jgi:hypothetical protein
MNREAGINALAGMGVALQLMMLGAVLLLLKFIWGKLFGKTTQKKLKSLERKSVALEGIDKNKRFSVNDEQANSTRNENKVDAYMSNSTVANFSESRASAQAKGDLSPKEYVEEELSPEHKSLNKHWSVAIKYQPSLIGLASRLSEISPKLSYKFKSKLIESKNFVNASSVCDEVLMDYLNKNFGPNEVVIIFAKKIIVDGFNDATEELKQAVNVFGGDIDAEFIINKIQRDFSLYHYSDKENTKPKEDPLLEQQIKIRESIERAFTEKSWEHISVNKLNTLSNKEQQRKLKGFLLRYEKNEFPLHEAVWASQYVSIELLLRFGFDPYKINKDGRDAFDLAVGDPDILKLLLSEDEWFSCGDDYDSH